MSNAGTDIIKFFVVSVAIAMAEKKQRLQIEQKRIDQLPFTEYELVQDKLPKHAENINC